MFENQKVDFFLDGLKSNHFIGLKSNILCNPTLRSDFNAIASHLKDMVYRTPQIHTPPGRQVSSMVRGGGRVRGTVRGGRDGRAGRDGRGGYGYDSVRGHGGRGNDRGRRGDRIPSTTTFRPNKCPDQESVDRAKPIIVSRYVTGERVFVGEQVYNSEMNVADRHAVLQIRADLKADKDPLGSPIRNETCDRKSVVSISKLSSRCS